MMSKQRTSRPNRFFFHGQLLHWAALTLLLAIVALVVNFLSFRERRVLGFSTTFWFGVSLAAPIVHQVYVWLAWRSELCFGAVTRAFGAHAFLIYRIVFLGCLLARPISLTLLTIADHDSLEWSIASRIVICLLLALPAVYTLYSVVRYFGISRAAGIDHFDESYRNKPLVNQGIFRYSRNAMYLFAFLGIWAIAVSGASSAALVVAAFSHAYIWIHYFCTERPDMQQIYG